MFKGLNKTRAKEIERKLIIDYKSTDREFGYNTILPHWHNLNYNLSVKFDDIRETAIKDSNYSILQGTSVTQSKIGELVEDKAIYNSKKLTIS